MRVNVLSYERSGGWILYDYAQRLAEHLFPHVDGVALSHVQSPGFDVTFHVNYIGLERLLVPGLHCTMITHIDTKDKFELVRGQAHSGVWGFCMSEETTRRLNTLTGYERFANMAPPSMLPLARKKVTVMVASRLYEDDRKNSAWVIDFARCFRPEDLVLKVMGSGWRKQLDLLRADGYTIENEGSFERQKYITWLDQSDYLLYTGNDEGALSTLDALMHGVVPIVTAQGYHLEQEGEIITFATREQMLNIGMRLQRELDQENARRSHLADWDGFARKHVQQWRSILAARQLEQSGQAQAAAVRTHMANMGTPTTD